MNIGKKLLSLLTVFCLTLSLVPTVALAEETSTNGVATEVKFAKTNYSNYITLNASTPYLASGGTSASSEKPNSGKYAYFHDGILALNEFTHEKGISATGDLKIELTGTNKIGAATYNGNNDGTTPDNDIKVTSGNLTIVGSGSLTLQKAVNTSLYVKGNLIIKDGADIKIYGGNFGQAIHTEQLSAAITITGSGTKVEATGGSGCSIKAGSGGSININDGAKLIASSFSGNLKINGVDATKEEKNQISSGITAGSSTPTYTVSGMVKDSGGQAIEGATVQLCTADIVGSSNPTMINTSTKTGNDGIYNFTNISSRSYIITISQTGYTSVSETIKVDKNNLTKNFILKSTPSKEETPSATFEATSATTGTLSNVISGMQYRVGDGAWTNITGDTASLSDLNVTAGNNLSIQIKKLGRQANNTTDSDLQTIQVTKAATPTGLSATPCTVGGNDGTITGVNTAMEWKPNDSSSSWADVNGTSITGLSSGSYLVRVKANHTVLASENEDVTIDTGYQVWVKDIQVTDANKDDILGDNSKSVTYTPANGDTPAILTLSNAHITNNQTPPSGGMYYIAPNGITAKEDLKINVIGTNAIESEHGHPIKAMKNLTISSDNSSTDTFLEVKSCDKMTSLSLDYQEPYNLTIAGTVNVKAIASDSNALAATAVSAHNIIVQDSAKMTAINYGKNMTVYCEGVLTVKDSSILIVQGQNNDNAITAGDFTYHGHIVTASTTFEGPSPNESVEPYNPAQLSTYKYVKVEPTTGIVVTGATLSKDNLSMKIGQSETLTKNLLTTDNSAATVQDVTWISDNPSIATVDEDGKVTAISVGTATITVLTKDGGYTDTCTVTVSNPSSSSGSHTTYYPVNTPAKSEGGSVVVSPKSASKGSAVTVTVTPESGYQVSSVQAVDKDGKKLTLTDKGDGKYTFVMPGSKVEVSASFAQVQKPEEPSPYRDVSKDSYYYDAVQWASDKGITNGVSDGVFAPDWVCTRGQIVTFLWRSVGSPAPKTAEMPFADVAEDAYYAQAVLWAVENGITKGTSETTFSPDQTCTRAHAVAFLYRLAGSPAVTGSSFQDVAADAYYNAAVAWAVQQGITNGTSETTFSPDETCTRAQIVTFLYRMDQAK